MTTNIAGASPVDRTVRPAAEARWYCLDRDGVAMLCKDEADARAQVIENDDLWPARAPHRAALLCDLEYLRDGGDFIPLAQPRMDALEAKNAALAREAHTWWTACRDATGEIDRLREVAARMVAGIDHLDKLTREWEPDHSSGADRRGWLLAKDARDDAARLLGPNAKLTGDQRP